MGTTPGAPARLLLLGDRARRFAPTLQMVGHSALIASGFEDALSQCEGTRPELMVVDLSMPSLEGTLAVLERLRAEPGWAELTALALVAPETRLDRPRAHRAGVVAEASAQIAERDLLALVESLLQIGRLQGDLLEINRALEERIAARTAELGAANAALAAEVAERKRVEDELRFSNAVLDTQQAASLDGILVVDGQGKIISFNQRFVDLWGLSAEVIESRSDELALAQASQRLVDPDDFLDKVRHLYAQRAETNRDELSLVGGVTFERYSAPLRGRQGEYLGRVWFFRDVTEQKRAVAALRESEQRYRRLVELSQEGIWVLDENHRTSFVNDRMAELLGVAKEEMLGKPLDPFLFEEDLVDHRERMAARRRGRADHYERRFRRGDGRSIWTIAASTPLFDEQGQFAGSFAMLTDITERKHFELALEEERRLFIGGKTVIFRWRNEAGWPMEYVSPNVQAQFGYASGLLTSGAIAYSSLVHPDDLERVGAEVAQYAEEQRESFEQRYRLRRADGEYRWVDDFTVVVRDARGRATHFHGYLVDITERVEAECALLDSEQKLKAAIYGSPIPQFVIDRDHRVVYWNRAVEQLTGIREREVQGTRLQWKGFYEEERPTMADLVVDATMEAIPSLYEKAQPSQAVPGVYEVTDYFGKLRSTGRWLRFSATAIRDAQGKVIGALETLEDVSEQINAERELELHLAAERAARQEAERVGRVKDEFLATLSHELRTPLNAILGWSQILRKGQLPRQQAEVTLERIERNARSLAGIVDDLLDVSRIISGQSRLAVEVMDLVAAVEKAIASIKPAADAKEIRVESRLDPAARKFYGDAARLQQVVWNLLSNAVKFTPRGGSVVVSVQHLGSHVKIEVRDTGIGIQPEFLPHVFERFRQADPSITRRYGGLGLGLAIVRHLVEMHGGTAQAFSPGENRGATFRLMLPLVPLREEGLVRAPAPPPAPVEPEREPVDLAGLRVLVVDDEPDARELVRWVLEEQHAEVEAAGSAAEAYALLSKRAPDVVVSDIAMPVEDGYSLIRRVRALPADHGGRVPALALTALVRAEDKAHAIQAGFQDHMAKPIDPQALIGEIAALAGRAPARPAHPAPPR